MLSNTPLVMNIRRLLGVGICGLFLFPGGDTLAGETRLDNVDPYFTHSSSLAVGAKGEELIDVSVSAVCGEIAWLFDHAEVVEHRNRFGDVQVVELPEVGCEKCKPIKLRWYHEPTGHLAFSVRVWRQPHQRTCDASVTPLHQNNLGTE